MSNDRIKYLLEQYAAGASTPEETKELFGWIREVNDDTLLKDKVQEVWKLHSNDEQLPAVDWNTIYAKITTTPVVGQRRLWPRIAAAAIIVVLLSAGGYVYFKQPPQKQIAKTETPPRRFKNDVAPGGNKAMLTLANGTQVMLDSAANGTITQQGNMKVIKLDSGQLAYQAVTLSEAKGLVGYNTITTPKGGQYQIVLADGSKVWLNAASSLKYPTAFTGKERVVELTGEGYFEVAHNAAKPFTVSVNGVEVHDIGTAFNINAYDDEALIRTTLLEGSVKVTLTSPSPSERAGVRLAGVRLQPGQQAQVSHSPEHGPDKSGGVGGITVQTADVKEAVAWKDGNFRYSGLDIEAIMRQAARWYDVEVEYKGKINETFSGGISRNVSISQLLHILELTNKVTFEINGKKIIVKPN